MNDSHDNFLALYEAEKDKLLTFFMYRVNFDRAQAEDLLMDATVKAFEKFHTFDSTKGKFKSWIFTIAANHLKNHYRATSGKATASLEDLMEEGFEPAFVDADDNAAIAINSENIQEVLSHLSDAEREIISLKYLQDFSNQEIAEMTERNEGAVRTQLSRAMTRFKTIFLKLYPQS